MHCAGLSLSRQSLLHKKSASHLIHLFTGVVLSCCALAPLHAALPDRISAHPDLTRSQALPNHHPLWANQASSIGAVPANTPINQLTLVLARSPEQQSNFEQFLTDQQNPASPDYHHWLTPAEVGERFGISDADIAVITSWLQSQGLTVNWIAPSKLFIGFGGPASSVNHAFQTELRTYRVNGIERMSVASDPQIPQALAPLITTIRGLYTINEQPNSHAATMQSPSPTLTLSNGAHYITPGDFQVIYGGSGITSGAGETIGIVGESRTDSADFTNFSQKTAAPFQNPTEIIPTAFGGIDPGPAYTAPPSGNVDISLQSEATLDVTRAGSIAPSANILLVVSTSAGGGIASATQYLVQTSPVQAQVISISFGACESAAGLSGVSFWASLFQQAAAEGISVFVSSGDSGASGCDAGFTAPPAAPQANSPNYICSSSYATCVGGTEFNDASGGYWSSSNGSNLQSALSYIPEGAWNEPQGSSGTQVAASGGGVSAYVATPSWQTGTGVPSARTGRYTPDISFSSSCHTPYFGCFAAAGGNCVTQTGGGFSFVGFCGTSASAPSMAGFAAVLNDQLGAAQGNLNPELYQVAANSPAAFHDATPASSGVASCDINTASMCNNSAPGVSSLSGGQAGYPLTVGYDEVTGLGSLNLASLINAFTDTLIAPTVAVSPATTSINATQSFSITVTVTAPSGDPTPTGSVHLTVGPYTSAATVLTAGSATITVPALSVPASSSTYTVTADYQPDAAGSTYYRTATGTANVTVNPIAPTVTVAASSTSITTAQSVTVSANVSGPAGDPTPTGTVLFNIVLLNASGSYSVSAPLVSGAASATVPIGALPPGQNAINATYTPDTQGGTVYQSALNSNQVDITVTQAAKVTPTIIVTPAASSITTLQSLTVNIAVATSAGNATGSVTLSSGTFTSSATALVNGAASVVVPAGALSTGTDTLTATYSGDNNSNSGTGAATVTVVPAPMVTPTLTITPSASTVSTNDILNVAVTVNTAAGYPAPTGTIAVSSGSYTQPPATLTQGSTNLTIDGNALPLGADTLNFSYSGDSNYNSTTGATSITVISPAFTIAGANVTIATPGEDGISPLTITPTGDFAGSITFSAALTSSPSGAIDPPTFTFGTPVVINGSGAAYTTLQIQTTSPTVSTLNAPSQPRSRWYAASGATFACILVLWIPRRRRRLRNLLSMVAMLVALTAGLLACGGGGGTSGGAGKGGSGGGTTPGTYTVAITATSGSTTASTSISVVVQ